MFFFAGGLARASADDRWFDPAFLEASTQDSGSGFILVPSPEVMPAGMTFGSIHRYKVKIGRGFWDRLEIGMTADLDGYTLYEDGVRNQMFMAKFRVLSAEKFGVGLSVGADQVGLEDLGFKSLGFLPKKSLENLDRIYAVAGAVLPFYPSLMVSAGWGSGSRPVHYFANASWVMLPGFLVMAEYDGEGTNFGGRLLLSPKVKLDLSLFRTQTLDSSQPFAKVLENNVRFGITYSEVWPPRREGGKRVP